MPHHHSKPLQIGVLRLLQPSPEPSSSSAIRAAGQDDLSLGFNVGPTAAMVTPAAGGGRATGTSWPKSVRTKAEMNPEGKVPLVNMEQTDKMWKAFLLESEWELDRDHPIANVFGPYTVDISRVKIPVSIVF